MFFVLLALTFFTLNPSHAGADESKHLCYLPQVKSIIEKRENELLANRVDLKRYRHEKRLELRKKLKELTLHRLNENQLNLTPYQFLSPNLLPTSQPNNSCQYLQINSPLKHDAFLKNNQNRVMAEKNFAVLFSADQSGALKKSITKDLLSHSFRAQFFSEVLQKGGWKIPLYLPKISYPFSASQQEDTETQLWKKGLNRTTLHIQAQAYPGYIVTPEGKRIPVLEELKRIYSEAPILTRAVRSVGPFGLKQLDDEIFDITFNQPKSLLKTAAHFQKEFLPFVNKTQGVGSYSSTKLLYRMIEPKLLEIAHSLKDLSNLELETMLTKLNLKLTPDDSFYSVDKAVSKHPQASVIRKHIFVMQLFMAYEFETFVQETVDALYTADATAYTVESLQKVEALVGKTAQKWMQTLARAKSKQCQTGDALTETDEHLFNLHLNEHNLEALEAPQSKELVDHLMGRCKERWGAVPETTAEAVIGLTGKSLFGLSVLTPPKQILSVGGVDKVIPRRFAVWAGHGAWILEVTAIVMQGVRRIKESQLANASYHFTLKQQNSRYALGISMVSIIPALAGGLTAFSSFQMMATGKGLNFLNPAEGLKKGWHKGFNSQVLAQGDDTKDPLFSTILAVTGFMTSTYAQWKAYSEGDKNPLQNPVFYVDFFTTYIKLLGFKAFVDAVSKRGINTLSERVMAWVKGEAIKQATNVFMNNTASDANFLLFGKRMSNRYVIFKTWYASTVGLGHSVISTSTWWVIDAVFATTALSKVPNIVRLAAKVVTNFGTNLVDQKSKSYALVRYLDDPESKFFNTILYGYRKACSDLFRKAAFCRHNKKPVVASQDLIAETEEEGFTVAFPRVGSEVHVQQDQVRALGALLKFYLKDKAVMDRSFELRAALQTALTTETP